MPIGIRVLLTLVAALFLGLMLFMGVEYMAFAFSRVAQLMPVTGWVLVGALIGAVAGRAVGLRRGGRPAGAPVWVLAFALPALLFTAGATRARSFIRLPTTHTQPPVAQYRVQVTTDELNVRSEPDRTAPVVGRVYRGANLEVTEQRNGWVRVLPSGGWISETYVARVVE